MARLAKIALRVTLYCIGLLLLCASILALCLPDGMHSTDAVRSPRFVEVAADLGFLGYAVLLLTSPRWLSHSRWAYWTLVLVTAGLFAVLCRAAASAPNAADRFAVLAVVFAPAALAILLVHWESRQPGRACR